MNACKRCGGRSDGSGCLCGNHSFELGRLTGAVGLFLHGIAGKGELGAVYRDIMKYTPGQHCNGCRFCPPVRPVLKAVRP